MKNVANILFLLTCSLATTALTASTAFGQPYPGERGSRSRIEFDNWNTNACELTDSADFEVDRFIRGDRIELWYRWHPREESVRYTLSQRGRVLRRGILMRGDCDPNQEKWCVAADQLDLSLRPGSYLIQTERPRVCQNRRSDGNGFVKVYGSHR